MTVISMPADRGSVDKWSSQSSVYNTFGFSVCMLTSSSSNHSWPCPVFLHLDEAVMRIFCEHYYSPSENI